MCRYCDRVVSWLSVGCCPECANAYSSSIRESRGINIEQEVIESREDMTIEQYDELMKTPIEQIKEEAIKEITDAGYGEDLQELGLRATIGKINSDLDKQNEFSEKNIIEDTLNEESQQDLQTQKSFSRRKKRD